MPSSSPSSHSAGGFVLGTGDAPSHGRGLHDQDRAARGLGIELIDAGPGRATTRVVVHGDMLNGAGKCHGGVIFTLADTAFQSACNSHGRPTVSSAASIQFVRPASVGDELIAVCVERYRSRSGGGYDVTVTRSAEATNSSGQQLVALFRGQAHELRPAAH